ncbi:MAG: asparagine synthase (glutamine-hydrolyzing) [Bacteroidota bacterium]
MCGIAGIALHDTRRDLNAVLRKMTDHMAHRGPDGEGVWTEGNIGLGHRRLSILDLSEAGAQPMEDPQARYVLSFNGEIYNYQEIKTELKEYSFSSTGDTEMILAAYDKWGPDCLLRFNGMFAIAIWDRHKKELFLARDRMGIKPVYMYQANGTFLFASEIRSLLQSGEVPAKLNRDALSEYLQYYSVNSPNTLIDKVYMLGAGAYLYWRAGETEEQTYWSLADQGQQSWDMSYEDLCRQNLDLLQDSVERRMISDVPLGAFLSGGIDSSAIVALMARRSEAAIHTFSVVFDEKEFDESTWSSMIAQKYQTSHHPIRLSPDDFLKELPDALDAMDHPSGDGINSYVVSKATRDMGFTVALSGLGGDELYAGYPVFKQYQQVRAMKALYSVPGFIRKAGAGIMGSVSKGPKVDRMKQMLSLPSQQFEALYPIFRQVFSQKEIDQLITYSSEGFSLKNILTFLELEKVNLMPDFSQVSVGEMSTYTQNVLLRDTDQMSMAHSLEVRVPFFDHSLVEFALGVSDKDKEPSFPKKFLVDSLGDLLPEEVVFRKKMGFVFPWIEWLKGPLKPLADKSIEQLAQRDIIQGDYLRDYWQRFLKGDSSIYWVNIWTLVVLEYWLSKHKIDA